MAVRRRPPSTETRAAARAGAAVEPLQDGAIRVLFVNDHLGYDGGITHGVTRYFLNVIPRLESRAVHAEACLLRGPHPAGKQLCDVGIDVTFLNRRKHDPRVVGDLITLVRRRRIDILHLAGMKSILLGRIAARRTGCRAVIHLHDTQPLGAVLGFLQRRVAGWTDVALGVSDPVRALAVAQFDIPPRRARTLRNGVPLADFASPPAGARQSIRREFHIDPDVPVVGMVGRLSPEKQHLLLIAALPRLLSVHPRAVLLIVGDGPLRQQCQELAERLGLPTAVRFAGYRTDVPAMLAAMDLVAAPSSREGFPYSVLEASAAGKPVVAFQVGGMPEVVSDGESGLLIGPQNVAGLIEGIARVLAQPLLAARLAEGARKRASEFSIEDHVRRLEVLYRHLMDGGTTALAGSW